MSAAETVLVTGLVILQVLTCAGLCVALDRLEAIERRARRESGAVAPIEHRRGRV